MGLDLGGGAGEGAPRMGRAFEYRRAAKEKRWDKMAKLFPKLARTITVTAKEGGPDPESNSKLRAAINYAKAQNMPKDNIAKAIERAESKDSGDFAEVNYEGKGPHGVLLWVECATDNNTRTFSNVRGHFNKGGGELMNSGALNFMFTRKAVVECAKAEGQDLEEIELALIDHGLEEMDAEGEGIVVTGAFEDFGRLCKGCEDLGLEVAKATTPRVPSDPREFSEEQVEEIEALIDRLEDDEDVQAVYTNIA